MRYRFLVLAFAALLAGCASAQESATKPTNLSFNVKMSDQGLFASCVQDALEAMKGGRLAISNSTDAQRVTHLMARIPGSPASSRYEWDIAISRAEPDRAVVERRSDSTLWGGPIGASDIRVIAGRCSN
jgi:hypothetical protein